VLVVQPGRGYSGNKELRSVCVWSRVRHGDCKWTIMSAQKSRIESLNKTRHRRTTQTIKQHSIDEETLASPTYSRDKYYTLHTYTQDVL
jgi:hypothetical protein